MNDLSGKHTATVELLGASDAPDSNTFEYPKDSIISYAQSREDVLLWRALQDVKRGFYVDVGAHDPATSSVTRAFYEQGWRGINIEPAPRYAEKLRTERPRDTTLEVALGDRTGMATLYDFGESGLSTLVKEIAERHKAAGFSTVERQVQITTLGAVLDGLGEQPVHFMKIDVEGYERQVLCGANFANVRPWIVLVEAVKPSTPVQSFAGWEPVILKERYEYVYFDGINRYYIAEEHSDLKRYFAAPVSICDPFRDGQVENLRAEVDRLERDRAKQADVVRRMAGAMVELERDWVANANDVVRLTGNVAGLKRDKDAHEQEAVRLKELVAALEEMRRVAGHEAARPGNGSTIPASDDMGDAAALARMVEAQAIDLARLRRALQAAQTLAAQRLELVNDVAKARDALSGESEKIWEQAERTVGVAAGDAERMRVQALYMRGRAERARTQVERIQADIEDTTRHAELMTARAQTILDWVRSAAVEETNRLQRAISDVLERSRWRKFGQRVGLARQWSWETGQWQSKLLSDNPPIVELLAEIKRLQGLLDCLRNSPWRRFGHWVGLAKRLPWETGKWTDEFLLRPFPQVAALSAPPPPARVSVQPVVSPLPEVPPLTVVPPLPTPPEPPATLQARLEAAVLPSRPSGEAVAEHATERFLEQCRTCGIETIFDVGAKDGQFAHRLRANGFGGHIVSFEPVSAAHAALVAAAASDPLWDIAERGALGASERWTEINRGTELCRITTLDSHIERTFSLPTKLFGLKIDMPGHEVEVLKGLQRNHERVAVIICEMSLATTRPGAQTVSELCSHLAAMGYRCLAMGPCASDSGVLSRVDSVFVKQRADAE